MLDFYGRVSLNEAIKVLLPPEREEFFAYCDKLATVFHKSFALNPTSSDAIAAESDRKEILDRLRELRSSRWQRYLLRALCKSMAICRQAIESDRFTGYNLDSKKSGRYTARSHLMTSTCTYGVQRNGARRSAPLVALVGSSNVSLDNWNHALREFTAENRFGVREIFEARENSVARTMIAVSDHTRCGLPLSCLLDSERTCCWTTSVPAATASQDKQTRRVSFWGQMEYRAAADHSK